MLAKLAAVGKKFRPHYSSLMSREANGSGEGAPEAASLVIEKT